MDQETLDKLDAVKKQLIELLRTGLTTCSCGRRRELRWLYRCLYCGEWYCHFCAERHFGKTVAEHKAEKQSKGAIYEDCKE